MRNFIIKIVNGRPGEAGAIIDLLTVGFLTGIFIATFDVGAITLFLKYFDEKVDVPRAFILSGILGVAFTYLFNKLQSIISYKTLVKKTIFTIAIIVSLVSIAINFITQKQLIFLAYVLFPPINAMVVLVFWGVFGRVFNFKSAKRLASGIDTGQVVATILAFFSIPFIQKYFIADTEKFLFISSASLFIAALVYLKILKRYPIQETATQEKEKIDKKVKASYKKYIILLSAFVVCSALAAAFIEYSFLTVTAEKFKGEENSQNLTSFISFFSGTVMICSFLIQTFLNDKILEMYGLRNTLILLPGLLLVFGIVGTAIGHIFGITSESVTFLFFFLIISISKLFSDALRDSLESPVFRNFFFPIDKELRFNIQSSIEGMVKEGAAFIAGLLMMAATLLSFYDVIFNNYILFGIVVCWIFVVFILYKEYHQILTSTLLKNKKDILDKHNTDYLNVLLTTSLKVKKKDAIYLTLKLTETLKPYLLELNLSYFAKEEKAENQEVYLDFVDKNLVFKLLSFIVDVQKLQIAQDNNSISGTLSSTTHLLKQANENAKDFNWLAHMTSSLNNSDRYEAALLIRDSYNEERFNLLLTLIRDFDPKTKRQAIITAGEHKVKELIPIIIESMADADMVLAATEALSKYGEVALPALDIAFYKNNQLTEVRLEIIALLGEIKGEKAIKMLLKKIDYPDHRVLLAIFNALKLCQWSGDGFDVIFVKNALNTLAATLLWNFMTLHELKGKKDFKEVIDAIKIEIVDNQKMIFSLLSLLYESRSINLVKENIEHGTSESIGFAIELLQIILEDDIKPYLLPLLDDSPILEKFRKLEIFFPRQKLNEYELMLELLNRDYNWTNRWTKICALKVIMQHKALQVNEALAANIFNPDPIIRELTASIIIRKDKTYFKNLVARASLQTFPLQDIAKKDFRSIYHVFERIRKVPLFTGFHPLIITEIAEFSHAEFYDIGEEVFSPTSLKDSPTFLLAKGRVLLQYKNHKEIKEGSLVSELLLPYSNLNQYVITTLEKSVLISINTSRLYNLFKKKPELIQLLLKNVQEMESNYMLDSTELMSNI